MSSKEPTLSPPVAELKSKGNAFFNKGDFEQAFDMYSAAIAEEKGSPSLFSNRSATAIHLKDYYQAVEDAQAAVKLDGNWDKAQARLGVAHEYSEQFQSSYVAYLTAAEIAMDEGSRSRHRESAERMMNKIQLAHQGQNNGITTMDVNDQRPMDRFHTLRDQGYRYGFDSSAFRHSYLVDGNTHHWKELQNFEDPLDDMPNGSIMRGRADVFHHFMDVSSTLMEDPVHSFVYPLSEQWPHPVSLIQKVARFFYMLQITPDEGLDPTKTIKHVEQYRSRHGWSSYGTHLSLTTVMAFSIRLPILQGLIFEIVAGDPGTALEKYSRAYRLISLARSKWPDQKNAIASLKRTFWRSIIARMLECHITLAIRNEYPKREMDQIELLANEQLKSCQKYPYPKPAPNADPREFVSWLSLDVFIRANAYLALALVHRIHAERKTLVTGSLTYIDREEGQRAIEYYLAACAWFPEDDIDFARSMWYAMEMQMRVGGISLAAMDGMIASAKKSEADYDRFYGRTDRSKWGGRPDVLENRKNLARKAAQRKLTDHSKVILNAVPIVTGSRQRVDISELIQEAEQLSLSTPQDAFDQGNGDDGATRISIIETFKNARNVRQREMDSMPAVFIDD